MKRILAAVLTVIFLAGCTTLERQAYNTVVGSSAFLKAMSAQLPGCANLPATMIAPQVCKNLEQARAAKNLLIDALELYCAGPNFNNGGPCDAPKKGAGREQLVAKLRTALAGYTQAASDLKGAIH